MAPTRDTTHDEESTKDFASNTSTPDAHVHPAQDLSHRPTKFYHIFFPQKWKSPIFSAKKDCFPQGKSHHKSTKSPSESIIVSILSRDGSRPSVSSTTTSGITYHVFSKVQKWIVFLIISIAGMFSGLSSNIYFPSLNVIAQDLNVSLETVSLSITSYLIAQGISPLIWSSISDVLGRRPIYIASFTVYIISNIVLSFSPNFAVLLVFRGLQAAGSAATVSIGNGVIQDISTSEERGGFIGHYQGIRHVSVAAGPVLGGLLAKNLGFRSIFVFLLITSIITLALIVVFLPETMRSIAGDGSIRQEGIYRPLVQYITGEPNYIQPSDKTSKPKKRVTPSTILQPLRLLGWLDILIGLVIGGVFYAVWSMVTSSTTGLFQTTFGFSEAVIGACFLPNGLGSIVGCCYAGRRMDKNFAATWAAYKAARNMPDDSKLSPKDIPADFPIERTRLQDLPLISFIFVIATAPYGFTLAYPSITSLRGWWAVPLVLQFFISASSNAVFTINQALLTDLCPGKGASASAINNLVRCGLAAVGVAFIEQLIGFAGVWQTFLSLALATAATTPLAVFYWKNGHEWRAKRTAAEEESRREDTETKV